MLPSGIVSTGWPAVRDKCGEFGDVFDTWQDGAGRAILGKRADGIYAATIGGVVLSIPRQVAKTFLVGRIIFALCVLFPGFRVIWTAHRTRTSSMTFKNLQGFARRKRVAPYIASVRTTNGEQEILFRNGSVIMFGAREQGFGRGFDEIDVEVFDEAQILTEKALEDMVAATNQSRHEHGALLFFMGTPPRPIDPGELFSAKRAKALSGDSDDMVYIECSADQDADPDDREQWEKANPSFPDRTPLRSMLRLRENLPSDEGWLREGLGIWDAAKGSGVIPALSWRDQADELSIAADRFALGVECGPDLAWASVALAGQRADGQWHFELDEDQHTRGRGVAWLAPHLRATVAANPQIRAVVVDVAGPIAALLEQQGGRWYFKRATPDEARLEATPVKVAELGAGCSRVLDGIVTGWLWHIGQPQFTSAALPAGKRPLGDTGMWVWSRKTAESDITPIQAGTLALIGAQQAKVRKPGRTGTGRSGGRRRGMVL
ncbi:hypothetical protein AB0B39_23605 [Micromonospora sp. NPDC049114]|uniref:hypothetical protein n=1 Tax=Micromonospora sp. NPDC049114 TaxID=3155498 RepID=UPI0033DA1381